MLADMESPDLDPSRWLSEHGDVLYRYALGRVRHPEQAEDLVQETLLAALRGAEGFRGQSTERTWLVGILRHKILDHFRRNRREMSLERPEDALSDAERYLDRKGHWKVGQAEWITQPEKAYARKEFWKVLHNCLGKLNERQRRIFELRELEDHNAETICDLMNISPSNLWVLLHRARLQLKTCLEENWIRTRHDPT